MEYDCPAPEDSSCDACGCGGEDEAERKLVAGEGGWPWPWMVPGYMICCLRISRAAAEGEPVLLLLLPGFHAARADAGEAGDGGERGWAWPRACELETRGGGGALAMLLPLV